MSSRSRTDPYILAIDLGTTSCKAGLVTSEGHLAALRRRPIPLLHPEPLWAEVDPQTWWDAVTALIPRVLADAGIGAEQVDAIGLSGLMHALVPVSANGTPLMNSMLWMDQRSQPECGALTAEHGERIRELTGGLPRTTASSGKLCWLQQHHPEIVAATHKFLLAKDFIRLKLTGEWATDPSDAGGTALLSRDDRTVWSEEYVRDILGVSPDKLPPIRPSTEIAGETLPETEAFGLRRGIPVITGCSDVRATVLGANLFVPGRVCLYMGTAAWVALGLPPEKGELRIRFLGATATFGAAMRWYVQHIHSGDESEAAYADLEAQAAATKPGADGLVFLPHLMGERGPYMSANATGVLFGLTLGHQPGHVFRSVLEGTACQIQHLLDERSGSEATELWCVGGGARLRLWLQIIADMTGLPLRIPEVTEAGVLGVAMLTGSGCSWFDDLEATAAEWVRPGLSVEPQKRPGYRKLYQRYRALDAAMQPFFS